MSAQHEPHDADAKAGPFGATEPGLSGLDTFLPLLLDLVRAGDLDLPRLVDAASVRPARVVGLEGGSLGVGAIADVCLFDPERRWDVSPTTLWSSGHNTPFLGRTLTGKVILTLVGGRVVFDERA